MLKKILKIIGVILLGMAGGALFEILVLPFLLSNPKIGQTALLRNLQREVVNNPVEEIIVQEGDGLKQAIGQVAGSVFKVGQDKDGQGCGFAVTADGLVVVPLSLIRNGEEFLFFNNQRSNFKLLNKDDKNNLALVKLEKSSLTTTSFADLEKVDAGEKVFVARRNVKVNQNAIVGGGQLSDSNGNEKQFALLVNEGIIMDFEAGLLRTNIKEEKSFNLCPAFNFKGELLGLAVVANDGQVAIMPNSKVRALSNF